MKKKLYYEKEKVSRKKLFIILFSIIMISFNGCRANSSELIENDNSKNNAKLVEAIFAVTGLDNSNEDKYTYYYEDLNDDGVDEVIVCLWGADFGGDESKTMIIFAQRDEGYEYISKTKNINGPIYITDNITNGYRDIVVNAISETKNNNFNVILKYVDETYPVNAATSEEVDINNINIKDKLADDLTDDFGMNLQSVMDS